MDQNENTKSGLEQNQVQAEPDVMQQESPRVCKVCGGPNHHGCGCEAKQQAQAMVDIENIHKTTQPTSEAPTPAPEEDDNLEDILGAEALRQSHESTLQMQKDIRTMADGFEGLCACMYDTNNYLKLIAGDMITIRKFLFKEDGPKLIEQGVSTIGNFLSYLSNIEQQLKEINARGENAKQTNQN